MSVYCVQGKLGSGKTLYCMSVMADAIVRGLPIATNIDIYLEHLPRPKSGTYAPIWRLPDLPSVDDLNGIGTVDTVDESQFGCIILDEAATWLNSRDWGKNGRAQFIYWMVHARKRGWHVYFLIQSVNAIDKQVRDLLIEYTITCRRADKINIPFVSTIIQTLSLGYFKGRLPKLHMASIVYGAGRNAMAAGKEFFLGRDYYKAYDTKQVFSPFYEHGLYQLIPPLTKSQKEKLAKIQYYQKLNSKPKDPFIAHLLKQDFDKETTWRIACQYSHL